MLTQSNKTFDGHPAIKLGLSSIALVLFLACGAESARAQGSFVSGSTGADGVLNPASNISIQVPPDGLFNYTSITIPVSVTVTFIPNANNTPPIVRATLDVTINGTISVSGKNGNSFAGGVGGPGGGGRGGNGGLTLAGSTQGQAGDGPGGGFGGSGTSGNGGGGGYTTAGITGGGTTGGQGGPAYGGITLLPLLGGSGGGGGSSTGVGGSTGGGGGGGGGSILIASSGNIIFGGSGFVTADGGNGGTGGGPAVRGGGGSGGAIRLMTNTISGTGGFSVLGGVFGGTSTRAGAPGFIRIEAFNSTGFSPNLGGSPGAVISSGLPGSVLLPPTAAMLRVVSVAGIASPASPLGSFQGAPDIVVPSAQANPVTVALEASNLPLGAVVDVTVTPERGASATVQSTPLSGTEANSTATASVTLSNVISVISARVVINLNPLKPSKAANQAPTFIDGERVDRMEIVATYGGHSEITFVTASGRQVKKPSH